MAETPPNTDEAETPHLEWQACATQTGFDCANARRTSFGISRRPKGSKINLLVIRLKASDPARRIGSLFFNPGGPGGAGTADMPGWQKFFPEGLRLRFDLVSWNPRGISDPAMQTDDEAAKKDSTSVQCFENEVARKIFFHDLPNNAFPEGQAEVSLWLKKMGDLANRCRQVNGELLDHVTTADTARDMELLRRAVGDSKLSYLGLSYGTFLGATYANLYPDRLRALVLDGNINPQAWYDKPGYSLSLRLDSDIGGKETLAQFLKLCGEAGKDKCEFSKGTAADTEAKWNAMLKRLEQGPIRVPKGAIAEGVPKADMDFSHALTVSQVATQLSFVAPLDAQKPLQGWKMVARILETIWKNRDTKAPVALTTSSPPNELIRRKYTADEQAWSVQCGDSTNLNQPDFFVQQAKKAEDRSGALGLYWSWNDSPCLNWPGKAADPYTGPWNRPTSAPILVIGNRFDPETVYTNSVAMAKELANARLLTVEGYGHTAMLNPSDCANKAVTRYFFTGEMPPEGKVCPQNHPPFP